MTTPPPDDISGSRAASAVTLRSFVARHAARLWHGYQADRPAAVTELARLRRTMPRGGVIAVDAWPLFQRGFPPDLTWDRDEASPGELAACAALALFALHQQSRRSSPMHVTGPDHRLGRAAEALERHQGGQGIERRVQALARSNGIDPILEHLRALIIQLRHEGIALDYAQLAEDLLAAQRPAGLRGVRTRWLRDFYMFRSLDPDQTDGADGVPTSEETP